MKSSSLPDKKLEEKRGIYRINGENGHYSLDHLKEAAWELNGLKKFIYDVQVKDKDPKELYDPQKYNLSYSLEEASKNLEPLGEQYSPESVSGLYKAIIERFEVEDGGEESVPGTIREIVPSKFITHFIPDEIEEILEENLGIDPDEYHEYGLDERLEAEASANYILKDEGEYVILKDENNNEGWYLNGGEITNSDGLNMIFVYDLINNLGENSSNSRVRLSEKDSINIKSCLVGQEKDDNMLSHLVEDGFYRVDCVDGHAGQIRGNHIIQQFVPKIRSFFKDFARDYVEVGEDNLYEKDYENGIRATDLGRDVAKLFLEEEVNSNG